MGMEEHNVFEQTLYDALTAHHVESSKQLKSMKEKDLDAILKEVRVSRLAQNKDKKAQKAVESELVHFEKLVKNKGKKKGHSKSGDKKKATEKKVGSKKKGGDKKHGATKSSDKKHGAKKSGDKKGGKGADKKKKKGTKKAKK